MEVEKYNLFVLEPLAKTKTKPKSKPLGGHRLLYYYQLSMVVEFH